MLNNKGDLVTSKSDIREVAQEIFSERLKGNKIKESLQDLEKVSSKLFEEKIKKAKSRKTPPWTMAHLDKVLKGLNTNKARDPDGLSNILLKPNIGGLDLKIALLTLMWMGVLEVLCGGGGRSVPPK